MPEENDNPPIPTDQSSEVINKRDTLVRRKTVFYNASRYDSGNIKKPTTYQVVLLGTEYVKPKMKMGKPFTVFLISTKLFLPLTATILIILYRPTD